MKLISWIFSSIGCYLLKGVKSGVEDTLGAFLFKYVLYGILIIVAIPIILIIVYFNL